MQYLIDFAQQSNVRNVIEVAMGFPSVQGVVLDIDPFWMFAWRLKISVGEERTEYIISKLFGEVPKTDPWARHMISPNPCLSQFFLLSSLSDYYIPNRPLSKEILESWYPPFWREYLDSSGLRSAPLLPLIIKVCLLPYEQEQEIPSPDDFPTGLPIILETRPPAMLYSDPKRKYRPLQGGVSIDASDDDFGTLGGILKDSFGNYYGLTCAHVLEQRIEVNQPARYDSRHASYIGTRTHTTVLQKSIKHPLIRKAKRCNPYDPGTSINEVDAALIKLKPDVSAILSVLDIGEISAISPKDRLTPTQDVEVSGRSSGHNRLQVGGLAVTYIFSHRDSKFCFKNLFELKWPKTVNTVRRCVTRPIKPGDSGAWVCQPSGESAEWCGMVIAGDREQGYAVFSKSIEEWWQSEGLNLNVIDSQFGTV